MMFLVGATLVEDFVATEGIPVRPVGFSGGRKAEEVLGVMTKKSAKRKVRAIMLMDGCLQKSIVQMLQGYAKVITNEKQFESYNY